MKLYTVETENGEFVTIGETEKEARSNFGEDFPNEKIVLILETKNKAVYIT